MLNPKLSNYLPVLTNPLKDVSYTKTELIIRLATARRLGLKDDEGWVIEEPLSYLRNEIEKYILLHNKESDPVQRGAYAGVIYAYAELFQRMAGISGIE